MFSFLLLAGCQSLPTDRYPSGARGVHHTVQPGQTVYSIAKTYGTSVTTLQRANRIPDLSKLKVGKRLWIPGARRVLSVPPTAHSRRVAKKNKLQARKVRIEPRKPLKGFLMWPVKGTLTSTFGSRKGRKHDGIDIGVKRGTAVVAAADGKVVFSDWGPKGYGLMVIVKHPNHLTTVYAHNSKNWVKKNDRVKKGQRIASVGSTGRATGPHLHFEVRNDTHPRNPLKFLPSKR